MTVTIRKLSGSDAAEYRAIRLEGLLAHPEAFGASWEDESLLTVDDFAERLERQPVFGAFLAETGAMVGTVGIQIPTASKTMHKGMIWGMYVRQEARGLGVGAALIQRVLDYSQPFLEQITLVVEASNVSAQKLYRKMGFEQYGYEPRALKIGNTYYDDVLMTLALKE